MNWGMKMEFDLTKKVTRKRLEEFAEELEEISEKIGFKQSARGWCYQLEGYGMITKAQFDKVENIINRCRKEGILPIDFTMEEEIICECGFKTNIMKEMVKHIEKKGNLCKKFVKEVKEE